MDLCSVTVWGLVVSGHKVDGTRLILTEQIAHDFVAWVAFRGGRAKIEICSESVPIPKRDDDEVRRGQVLLSEYAHTRR